MSDPTHQVVWFDIPVTDLDRAIAFYSAVLGQEVAKLTEGGTTFAMLHHADNNVSGCLVEGRGNSPSNTGPLIYLNANGRLDEAIAAVEPNGGEVVQSRHAIGPYGFRAIILDSEGNRLALHSD